MFRKSTLAVLCALFWNFPSASAQQLSDAPRGELLYSTHCGACHDARIHWRDKRLATNWKSLLAEVRHWEGFSQLGWSDDDVAAVAQYLNARYYRYSAPD